MNNHASYEEESVEYSSTLSRHNYQHRSTMGTFSKRLFINTDIMAKVHIKKWVFRVEGIKTTNEKPSFIVDVFHCFSVKWMPADSRGLALTVRLPRGVKKLWRDTAITQGPVHTSLAAEYPLATHGQDSVPWWLNKITFKSVARWRMASWWTFISGVQLFPGGFRFWSSFVRDSSRWHWCPGENMHEKVSGSAQEYHK